MSRTRRFTKMHGAGNDYVVLDGIREELPPIPPLAARLCDRHFGIGCDQLLVARPSRTAAFRMEIYNADGSQVAFVTDATNLLPSRRAGGGGPVVEKTLSCR